MIPLTLLTNSHFSILLIVLIVVVPTTLIPLINAGVDLYKFKHSINFIKSNEDSKVNYYLHYIKMTQNFSSSYRLPFKLTNLHNTKNNNTNYTKNTDGG